MRDMDDKYRKLRRWRAKFERSRLPSEGRPTFVKNRSSLKPSEKDQIRATLKGASQSTKAKITLVPMPWDEK